MQRASSVLALVLGLCVPHRLRRQQFGRRHTGATKQLSYGAETGWMLTHKVHINEVENPAMDIYTDEVGGKYTRGYQHFSFYGGGRGT